MNCQTQDKGDTENFQDFSLHSNRAKDAIPTGQDNTISIETRYPFIYVPVTKRHSNRSRKTAAPKFLPRNSKSNQLDEIKIGDNIIGPDGESGIVVDIQIKRYRYGTHYYLRLESRKTLLYII
ncbi:hypothetical protein QFZ20_000759 [Flavobacterium sp. W4I14]|nr:hypothetical protein [Flavobacterium sp. W4I14]